ncbi:hypothetical protein HK099_005224 [Clydaea vesicula]|uniref:Cleavage and polyadenylation specificity factor subunit 5 n=1 Tax=Clydaea vesicula TaxID=447962 RepID=A0AAD5UBZ1_9FUNG|nr:hypothetical protein HK099_005224 [Clydaea vesicula]KAJ3396986.1 hypothetical protein HDU92_001277 [Lobulomyces angularis]
MSTKPTINLYPLENYTIGQKDPQPEDDPSVAARLNRLQHEYEKFGMRTSVEGVLMVHEQGHPHILIPGDNLKPGEDELQGLKDRLNQRLAPQKENKEENKEDSNKMNGTKIDSEPPPSNPISDEDKIMEKGDVELDIKNNADNEKASYDEEDGDYEIGELLTIWYRPNFETYMYPYIPRHITRPKETKKFFIVQLPERKVLSVPKNMKLLAVPLFELHENTARYGPQLAALPHLLSIAIFREGCLKSVSYHLPQLIK